MNLGWKILLASGGLVELLWLPILARFLRQWRKRHNPVSLAIATLVAFIMFVITALYWVFLKVDVRTILVVNHTLCGFVALNFHVAFWRARKLPDERRRDARTAVVG